MLTTAQFHAGLDVGSTTLKFVIVNPLNDEIVFSEYRRHNTDIPTALSAAVRRAQETLGAEAQIALTVTGSAGMGLSEAFDIPFMQEVIAAAEVVAQKMPEIRTLVDIGGEDAKMIFFAPDRAPDIRMNGSCAGGTGAFIDQVATLLNVDVSELDTLAKQARQVHPIASRCGVFAKTDIQNLLARNVSPADIAASVFHAVALQIVTTLARGHDIEAKLLLCGGPLAFIPSLRDACEKAMNVRADDAVVPENAALIPATGCAIAKTHTRLTLSLTEWLERFSDTRKHVPVSNGKRLSQLFDDDADYQSWKARKNRHALPKVALTDFDGDTCYLGIDSGSTTTKLVAIDDRENVLFTFYEKNAGNPLATVQKGFRAFFDAAQAAGKPLKIASAAVTGYGEDLIRAAFDFDKGLVETIAHYLAAHRLNPDVTFILDIGGQDMKATFIENGAIIRLDINEACSSGCGSFIESFANTLGQTAAEFAVAATRSDKPCDLGTRCTVFMNSKVKQSLREGSTLNDISAGLAYSVVKNCLYKVLKLRSPDELGAHIVVQGGTMRNHAVVRALEQLTGRDVAFADMPELMGAYGAALHALRGTMSDTCAAHVKTLAQLTDDIAPETSESVCPGCENKCAVRKYVFGNDNTFFSGNKCEKIFTNRGDAARDGKNVFPFKFNRLAKRVNPESDKVAALADTRAANLTIGIPRALNYYENFPFWRTLFAESGITVVLSERSTFDLYEKGAATVMSDNICFPAKLVHGHVFDLIAKNVNRIFMPFVVMEKMEEKSGVKSFNCPIVSGYSDVIRGAVNPEGKFGIPLDAPSINFNDEILLARACRDYLVKTLGVPKKLFDAAFPKALAAQEQFLKDLSDKTQAIADAAARDKKLLIVLAGRPYHTDNLIQHRVAEMISAFGVDVINEDIVRFLDLTPENPTHPNQWLYSNRILKAARWVASQPSHVHFVQLTSFGCGPDAFMNDEIGDALRHAGKSHTVLKIDDINNLGSLRLRIRSLIESLDFHRLPAADVCGDTLAVAQPIHFVKRETTPNTPPFTVEDKTKRTILAPFFSEVYSPMIEGMLELMGYKVKTLPPADAQSVDYGLQYANNEVCYPATLVVGDIIRALKSGEFNPEDIAVGITQTGGQCRASSYLGLIKKAMHAAGYGQVPVVSLATAAGAASTQQPGFTFNWKTHLRLIIVGILFADCIGQMYHATAPREIQPGAAAKLRDHFIAIGASHLRHDNQSGFYTTLREATMAFNAALDPSREPAKIGVVGEIYVKYNSIGNKNIVEWLIEQGIEPIVAPISNFFLQELPNYRVNVRQHLKHKGRIPQFDRLVHTLIQFYLGKMNRIGKAFAHFIPFPNIYHEAEQAARVINLAGQYGEGWLIPAEFIGFAESGVFNAVSLQPFGCIANHVVAKGIEKRVRDLYPRMNLLFLDLDSGASEANLLNRLHFLMQNAKEEMAIHNS
jgi:predicted CoA-substrate-specific enzyme activase